MLHLDEQTAVLVAEACSGLRLLTAFVFTAALVAFVIKRPAWQKVIVLLSGLPIAVLANAVRVLATSVVVYWAQNTLLEQQFHDVAGLLMMPFALLLLVGELKFLALLTTTPPDAGRNPPWTPAHGAGVCGAGGLHDMSTRSTACNTTVAVPRPPALSRACGVAAALTLLVLLAGGWGQRALQARINLALDRVAPLQRPLASLPEEIGPWRGTDVPLDERVRRAAHFDDEFINRRYVNPATGEAVSVFVGYLGRARARLGHRPDVCYAAHGWNLDHAEPGTVAVGGGRDIPVLAYDFRRADDPGAVLRVLATYVVNGRYVRDVDEFRRYNARGANLLGERPAYLARIQVALPGTLNADADLDILRRFIADLAEPTANLLPYWEP